MSANYSIQETLECIMKKVYTSQCILNVHIHSFTSPMRGGKVTVLIVCVCLSVCLLYTALAGAIKINVGIELKFLVQKL